MTEAFCATQEIYSRHFNQPVSSEGFPISLDNMKKYYDLQFADEEVIILIVFFIADYFC